MVRARDVSTTWGTIEAQVARARAAVEACDVAELKGVLCSCVEDFAPEKAHRKALAAPPLTADAKPGAGSLAKSRPHQPTDLGLVAGG
ncbi:MAG: hypothetical protein ACK4QW_00195 [Alphaproteobacteria bacterium]